MTTRREFLRLTALASAAGYTLSLPRSAFAAEEHLIYGVQLFMVRREAAKSLAPALKSIHDVGFAQVELYPIAYTHPAAELKQMVADSGLGCASAHFDYSGLDSKVEYAQKLGLTYMVCPMLPEDRSLAGFTKAAEDFNRVGKMAKDAGMTFCFHNHCYEFKPQENGVTGFQLLMDRTDPQFVSMEFDMYWLTQAGQDPSAVLAKYNDRAKLIHLKDRAVGAPTGYAMGKEAEHFAELGKGSIDWPALLAQAKRQGIKYAFLDQDETAGPVFASMAESYQYLKKVNV